jgi:type I restriction enzyme S subunit
MMNTASSELREKSSDPLASTGKEWPSGRLKHLVQINPGSISGDEPDEWEIQYIDISSVNGRGEIEETDSMPFEEAPSRAQRLVRDGDTIVSTVRTYLKAIAHVENPPSNMVVSTGFAVLRPGDELVPRFVWRTLQAKPFVDWIVANSEGVSYPAIAPQRLGELVVPLPPIEKQQAIAGFLDRRTARIDALVEKQKRLLDLLDEKRQAFITRAVTEGLDSTVATKNTEVEWLDEIPEHWEFVRLKFLLYEIEQGWSPQCEDRPTGPDEWGVLKAGCMNNMDFKPEEHKRLPDDLNPRQELEIEQGDVLMSRANTRELVGSCGRVDERVSKLLLCDKLYRLDLRESAYNSDFFVYVANSDPSRKQIEIDASGASSSMVNISQDFVKEMYVPLPPQDEQEEITQYLDEKLARIHTLKTTVQTGIDLLSEKRQALITAAVTGQIDVTEERGEIQDQTI